MKWGSSVIVAMGSLAAMAQCGIVVALGYIYTLALGGIVSMTIVVLAMGAFSAFFAITFSHAVVHGFHWLGCHVRNVIITRFCIVLALSQSMVLHRGFPLSFVILFSIRGLLSCVELIPRHGRQGHYRGDCILHISLVSLHVQGQVVRSGEGLVTLFAHIGTLPCMPSYMSCQLI